MSYKENEVVAKYTKGNSRSDCGKYSTEDLLEMFDQAEITVNKYGGTNSVTVNDCTELYANLLLVTKDLVVTSESDDMFCYYNNDERCDCGNELEGKDVICESCEDEITDEYIITKVDYNDDGGMPFEAAHTNHDIVIPCSAELDNAMYNESI